MAGQRIGYNRVSSLDQNTVRQLEGVQLEKIFVCPAQGQEFVRGAFDAEERLVDAAD